MTAIKVGDRIKLLAQTILILD